MTFLILSARRADPSGRPPWARAESEGKARDEVAERVTELQQEIGDGSRVVMDSEHVIAICPYAPRFPFETWILPKAHDDRFGLRAQPLALDADSCEIHAQQRSRPAVATGPPQPFTRSPAGS